MQDECYKKVTFGAKPPGEEFKKLCADGTMNLVTDAKMKGNKNISLRRILYPDAGT